MVIRRSKCLFCKLGTNWLTFHPKRNALAVAVIWTKGRKDCSVKYLYMVLYAILLIINIKIFKRVTLPVVLCWCEYSSSSLGPVTNAKHVPQP
jgi:hypothetical protein